MESKSAGVLGTIFQRFLWVVKAKLGGQTEPGDGQKRAREGRLGAPGGLWGSLGGPWPSGGALGSKLSPWGPFNVHSGNGKHGPHKLGNSVATWLLASFSLFEPPASV